MGKFRDMAYGVESTAVDTSGTKGNIASTFDRRGRSANGDIAYRRNTRRATQVGEQAIARGDLSVAVGPFALAGEDESVSVGAYSNVSGHKSVGVGYGVNITGADGTAVGHQAVLNGVGGTIVGKGAAGDGDGNTVIGDGASATGDNSTAVGENNIVTGDESTSIGEGSTITGDGSSSVGQNNTITHDNVVTVGNSISSTANGQVIIGSPTTTFSEVYLGRGVTHTGAASTIGIHATDATGTDVAGDHLALMAGRSTGTGAGGNLDVYRTSTGTGSGGGQNGATLVMRVQPNGDVYFTGTGTFPTFGAGFDNIGMVRVGPSRSAANSGILLNNSDVGNGHMGEFAVIGSSYLAIAQPIQGSAQHIPIVFFNNAIGGGGALNGQVAIADGMWVGDESAISMLGQGTINVATGVYLGGTAYTNPDYVFEHHFKGKIEKFKNRRKAAEYKGRRTLDEVEAYAAEHLHLPQLNDIGLRKETGDDIFERADGALLLIEELYLHIFELNKRIKELEKPKAAAVTRTRTRKEKK